MSTDPHAKRLAEAAARESGASGALPAVLGALAVGLAAALILVLDRIGMPERLVSTLACAVVLLGVSALGLQARTMQLSRFFAAARALPVGHAALAAGTLAFALMLPFVPGLPAPLPRPGEAGPLFIGLAGGLLVAAVFVAPLLRRSSAFSLTDLLAARFPNPLFRVAMAFTVAAISGLLALTGLRIAAPALMAGMGISPTQAIGVAGLGLILILVPAGFVGAQRAALLAGGCALAGFAALLVFMRAGAPGSLALDATGGRPAFDVFAGLRGFDVGEPSGVELALAAMLGCTTLPPLVQTGFAAATPRAARRAGLGTLLWTGLFAASSAAALGLAASIFAALLAQGAPPPWLFEPGPAGAPSICAEAPRVGANGLADALKACASRAGFAGQPRAGDIAVSGLYLLASLPRLLAVNPAARALTTAVVAALGLALAAAGIQGLACAVGYDALRGRLKAEGVASTRLALTRIVIIGAIAALCAASVATRLDAAIFEGLAVGLGAAMLTPVLILALWPRAGSGHALAALVTGGGAFVLATASSAPLEGFGQLAAGAIVGCCAALLAGFGLSFATHARPEAKAAASAFRRGEIAALRRRSSI